MLKWAADYRSFDTAWLIQRNLSTIGAPLRPEGGKIRVDALGLTLDPALHEEVLRAMPAFLALKAAGAEFAFLENGRVLQVRIGDARFETETFHLIYVLQEVFAEEIYGISHPEPMVVWDVGANIGAAAIYFSSVYGWLVEAYELFPATAEEARRNISLSGVSDLVRLHAVGLGAESRQMRLPYSEAYRETNGLFGNLANEPRGPDTEVEVEVLGAAAAFESVRARADGRPIYLKLDCEGAEYEILDRLETVGALREIAAMAVEVHAIPGQDPSALVGRLVASGFTVHGPRRLTGIAGMLHAVQLM